MRFILDSQPLDFTEGDSIASAIVRSGQHPAHGGTICLAGDCGNCAAIVDGTAWVRTCQTPARPGTVVARHPEVGAPSLFTAPEVAVNVIQQTPIDHKHADVVIIGASQSGLAEADRLRAEGRDVLVMEATEGLEVLGVYAGPLVVARTPTGQAHVHAHEVVVATGASELHPTCPGNRLKGLFTTKAASALVNSGHDLGQVAVVGRHAGQANLDGAVVAPGDLLRFEGDPQTQRVIAIITTDDSGQVVRTPCDTAVIAMGTAPRDLLARMGDANNVRAIGPAAAKHDLPPCPTSGMVCPCSKINVDDLHGVWDRGFHDLELMKRSALVGTGTCQGSVCLPHLQAFIHKQTGTQPEPFTARPASRQMTMGEAAAGFYVDAWKRTPLHDEHLALNANMDRFGGWWRPWNYGDHIAEYWAVREGVSLGDVSTLGKMVVTGPDAIEFLERIYPTNVADIKPGRSRYVLLLNERGHLIDDGMICREGDTRFVLSFTSGGASSAEAWMRDWLDMWQLDVRLMDRTQSLGAINVTGPLASTLLRKVGVAEPPKFLQHRHDLVADVPCHIMRLSFTGEASFELHHPWDRSVELWRALMEAGREFGIRPHGLQALFGLRLEKGHIIVGMDTEMDTTPRRIDHDWAVKMQKPFFLGQEALARIASLPDNRKMIALAIDGPAPIEGSPIRQLPADGVPNGQGVIQGHAATTFFSPLLGHTISLGWLKRSWDPTQPLPEAVECDGRVARLTTTPFYDVEGARARL